MTKKTLRSASAVSMIESLENRTLLSAAVTDSSLHMLEAAKKKLVTPHVELHVSKRVAKLGTTVKFNVSVSYPKRLGTLAGDIEFFDGNNVIQAVGGALAVPLGPKNTASYTFAVGNDALYVGIQGFAAAFVSSNTVPDGTSKLVDVGISVPKFKTASNDLETATIIPGHGKPITAGQTAMVLYTGFLESTGQVFDYATADHGPGAPATLSFAVEANPEQVIPGFDQGLVGMRVGETRVIAMPSQLGYGAAGTMSIPPDADLVFLVKLLSIT